jgi:hypothetical protein
MKTALLLSGNARFCAEFDMQLDNLLNSEIDWYLVLWNRRNGDGHDRDELMSPGWTASTVEEARAIIEPKLPAGHRIAHIELVDPSEFPPLTKEYKHIDCNVNNLFHQYWMVKRCDQRRQESGIAYDLVIRSRPDVGIEQKIDLPDAKMFLTHNPECVITPYNHRNCGYNDMFAIGLPDTMRTYCSSVDFIDHFNLELNVKLHSETIISAIVASHGIQWPPTDIRISLREQGVRNGDHFVPDFGRWA